MDRPTHLHPVDEKTLTAKAMAFSVLLKHEHRWSKEEPGALLRLEESIRAAGVLQGASTASVGLPVFLKEHRDYIRSTVAPLVAKPSALLDPLLDDLDGVGRNFVPLSKQAERWLANIQTVGNEYLKRHATRKVKLPRIHLYHEANPSNCALRGLGGVTHEENGERIIWLSYDPERFGRDTYFSIPYVLSHEFWCHAISRLPLKKGADRTSVFGADPANAFEEGWMDYIQLGIFQRELSRIVATDLVHFDDHAESFHHERNRQPGNQFVHLGVMAAKRFEALLDQHEREWGLSDSTSTFLQASLDLNLLPDHEDAKSDLVVELAGHLGVSAPEEGTRLALARDRDRLLEAKRRALAAGIKRALSKGNLDPVDFIKLLKIKPI
jgi:hypothetical protein